MSRDAFCDFLFSRRIISTHFNPVMVEVLWSYCTQDEALTAGGEEIEASLDFPMFVQLLLLIANFKFASSSSPSQLSQRFKVLMTRHILLYGEEDPRNPSRTVSCSCDHGQEAFLRHCLSVDVRSILEREQKYLLSIFLAFSSPLDLSRIQYEETRMDYKGFMALIHAMPKPVADLISERDREIIFLHTRYSPSRRAIQDPNARQEALQHQQITFFEFENALAALSTLCVRYDHFLISCVSAQLNVNALIAQALDSFT